MAAADRVTGNHRDDRLGGATDLDVQVGDVEAPDTTRLALVSAVAADTLIAAGAERIGTLTGEHDHADGGVVAGPRERLGQLEHRLRAKGVADLGAVDRDLGDPGVA